MSSDPIMPSLPEDTGSSTLRADSTYDDQGLLFALALCGCLLSIYIPYVMYVMGTSTLWLKRFYRPNHTVEPPPRPVTPPASPTSCQRICGNGGVCPSLITKKERSDASEAAANKKGEQLGEQLGEGNTREAEGSQPVADPSFPTCEVEDSYVTHSRNAAGSPPTAADETIRRRRKRLGISLPYRSTLFQLPSWRDWIAVEENVPHLESALSLKHVTNIVPARYTGSRSYMPLARSPSTTAAVAQCAAAVAFPTSNIPVTATATGTTERECRPPTPRTPLSPFSTEAGGVSPQRSYGTVNTTGHATRSCQPQGAASTARAAAAEVPAGLHEFPRTPLDPQVALYIFTLKFFLSLMLLGECFTIWVSVIASQDDYNEFAMVQLDTKQCHRQDANETGCLLKRPHCQYLGEDLGCSPVALKGLYDLTAQNITPGSWRWWPVVLLNCGFCLVVVGLTLFYLRRVSDYVTRVMALQMRYALGYRVACVRGVDAQQTASRTAFSTNFLDEAAYFVPLEPPHARRRQRQGGGGTASSSGHRSGPHHTYAREEEVDEFDYYEQLDCNGLDCLFGVAGCHFYTTHRSDAVFTRPGKVKQVLFTRKPPGGIYSVIGRAESAMADMQDVVAEEKAVKRRMRRRRLRDCRGALIASSQQAANTTAQAAVTTEPTAAAAATRAGEQGTGRRSPVPAIGLGSNPTSTLAHGRQRKGAAPRTHHYLQNRSLLYSLASLRGAAWSDNDEDDGEDEEEEEQGGQPLNQQQVETGSAAHRKTTDGRNRSHLGDEGSLPSDVCGQQARPSNSTTDVVVVPVRAESTRYSSVVESTEGSALGPGESADNLVVYTRTSMLSCCQEVPALPYYEDKLRRAANDLNRMLERVPQQPADSATFVIFADARSAFEFINLFKVRYGGYLSSVAANIAGPPGEIISNNMLTDKLVLGIRFIFVFCLFVVLVFSYSIPIGILGSLENLSYVPGIASNFSEYYVENVPGWLRNIINAYLPVIALSLFYVALPFIIRFMVILMGAFNKAECDAGQLYLQYIFMVLTAVIFQAALQGGFAQLAFLATAGEGRYIAEFFVSCVTPSKANYFYAKVLTALSFSVWNDLVDPIGILKALLFRASVHVQRNYDALFMPCELEYPRQYSMDLMFLAMGLLFHMTMPLLGLFVTAYFVMRYFAQRAKLYDRYRPTNSPAQDCTDFTVCAQVLRAVMWLYCLAELCGVLLLSLRSHTGGVVVCSLTFMTALALLVHVHMQTRKWIPSLGRARQFAREPAEWSRQSWRAAASTGPTATAAEVLPTGPSPSAATATAADMDASVRCADSVASVPEALSSFPRVASPTTTAAAVSAEAVSGAMDYANMDSYENVRFNLFDDSHSNPFIGHLLPRLPDASCRYQPKHQRLAPLDVDAELDKMLRSTFVVERYWDRGMTWFEADAAELGVAGATNVTTMPASPEAPGNDTSSSSSGGGRMNEGTPRSAPVITSRNAGKKGPGEPKDILVVSTDATVSGLTGNTYMNLDDAERAVAQSMMRNDSMLSPLRQQMRMQAEAMELRASMAQHHESRASGANTNSNHDESGDDKGVIAVSSSGEAEDVAGWKDTKEYKATKDVDRASSHPPSDSV